VTEEPRVCLGIHTLSTFPKKEHVLIWRRADAYLHFHRAARLPLVTFLRLHAVRATRTPTERELQLMKTRADSEEGRRRKARGSEGPTRGGARAFE